MLEILTGATEHFDEKSSTFVKLGGTPLVLEHSLLSLSKWEEMWEKPFLTTDYSQEELVSYVECMVVSGEFDPSRLSESNFASINEYLGKKRTATVVTPPKSKRNDKPQVITSELIYSWMVAHQIPVEFERWFLNRLLVLIQVCNANASQDNKKSSRVTGKQDLASRRAEMEARRQQYNTNG